MPSNCRQQGVALDGERWAHTWGILFSRSESQPSLKLCNTAHRARCVSAGAGQRPELTSRCT